MRAGVLRGTEWADLRRGVLRGLLLSLPGAKAVQRSVGEGRPWGVELPAPQAA